MVGGNQSGVLVQNFRANRNQRITGNRPFDVDVSERFIQAIQMIFQPKGDVAKGSDHFRDRSSRDNSQVKNGQRRTGNRNKLTIEVGNRLIHGILAT